VFLLSFLSNLLVYCPNYFLRGIYESFGFKRACNAILVLRWPVVLDDPSAEDRAVVNGKAAANLEISQDTTTPLISKEFNLICEIVVACLKSRIAVISKVT
jgi:hypothetical protein